MTLQIKQSKWKKYLPVIVALVLALVASYIGMTRYKQEVKSQKEMAVVIVASRDIAPYTVLDKNNLKQIEVPIDRIEPESAKTPEEVLGKMAITRILTNEQIHKGKITNDRSVKEKEIIAVNVDMTRALAGWVQPGDVVDVWNMNKDSSAGVGNTIIAQNAILLDIRDSSGKSIFAGTQAVLSSITSSVVPSSPPAIAVLVVDKEYIPSVVSGSGNQNSVLVKKFTESKRAYIPAEVPQQTKTESIGAEQNLNKVQNMFNFAPAN